MNENEKNKGLHIAILVIGIILHVIFLLIMGPFASPKTYVFNGVMAQIQVVISAVLVTTNGKRGFITSCVLNAFSIFNALQGMLTKRLEASSSVGAGIAVPAISIITMTIIYTYLNQAQQQKAEISEQYEKIMDANRIMQEKDEALRALLYTDRLTGLYSAQYFQEKIEEAIKANMPFTLLYIDIDNFKSINDTFGPKTGNAALKVYADRVKNFCDTKYTCSRVSGDEFGILMTDEQTEADILNLAEQLRTLFRKQITAQLTNLSVTASFGIVQYPNDGNDAELLLDNAIIAVYNAKANGKDRACFFSKTINQSVYVPESRYYPE